MFGHPNSSFPCTLAYWDHSLLDARVVSVIHPFQTRAIDDLVPFAASARVVLDCRDAVRRAELEQDWSADGGGKIM